MSHRCTNCGGECQCHGDDSPYLVGVLGECSHCDEDPAIIYEPAEESDAD